MARIPLHWQIVAGLALGVLYALMSSWFGWSAFTADWIAPWGRIFVNLLKLIAVPLVLFSIVGGIASLGSPKQLGKMGVKTLAFYLATSLLAIALGLAIAVLAKPGRVIDGQMLVENRISYELWAKGQDVVLADKTCLLCDTTYAEIVKEVALRAQDNPEVLVSGSTKEISDRGPLTFVEDWVPGNIFSALGNNGAMLQVIFFALLMGIALVLVPQERSEPLLGVVNALSDVFIKMVEVVMKGAPFFVFALMASLIAQQTGNDPSRIVDIFKGLGVYGLCVLGGLFMVAFVIYPLIVKYFVSNMSFRSFLKCISPAQLLAFSTSSSAATLPVSMECAEENLKIDNRVASFVLPIGSTVNMDGTSLYQALAVVFLAQMHGVVLGFDAYLTILFTTMMASIGSAAIPGAGIVMMMVVLSSVGLNPAWIAIILPIDRLLDMFRTVVNVTGDLMVALVVDRTRKD